MFVKLAVIACSLALTLAAYNGPLAGGQPAALYPAGVDPKACPNFPDCSNPSVAVNQVPEQPQYAQYQSQPQYQPQQYQQYQQQPQQYQQQPQQYQPQYQPQPQQYQPQPQQYQPQQYSQQQQQQPQYSADVQNALNRGEYIGDGDYHGEGLAEALAPGHADIQQRAYNPAPVASQYNAAPVASQYNPAVYSQAQYNQAGAHAQPAQIPAGVDASSCPNYPFCS